MKNEMLTESDGYFHHEVTNLACGNPIHVARDWRAEVGLGDPVDKGYSDHRLPWLSAGFGLVLS